MLPAKTRKILDDVNNDKMLMDFVKEDVPKSISTTTINCVICTEEFSALLTSGFTYSGSEYVPICPVCTNNSRMQEHEIYLQSITSVIENDLHTLATKYSLKIVSIPTDYSEKYSLISLINKTSPPDLKCKTDSLVQITLKNILNNFQTPEDLAVLYPLIVNIPGCRKSQFNILYILYHDTDEKTFARCLDLLQDSNVKESIMITRLCTQKNRSGCKHQLGYLVEFYEISLKNNYKILSSFITDIIIKSNPFEIWLIAFVKEYQLVQCAILEFILTKGHKIWGGYDPADEKILGREGTKIYKAALQQWIISTAKKNF